MGDGRGRCAVKGWHTTNGRRPTVHIGLLVTSPSAKTIYIICINLASHSQLLHGYFCSAHLYSIPSSPRPGSLGTRRGWQGYAKPDAPWNVLDSKRASDFTTSSTCQRGSCSPSSYIMPYPIWPCFREGVTFVVEVPHFTWVQAAEGSERQPKESSWILFELWAPFGRLRLPFVAIWPLDHGQHDAEEVEAFHAQGRPLRIQSSWILLGLVPG